MKKLINKLNYYTRKYDEGNPEISDAEWDKLYFHLQEMERRLGIIYPNSPTQKISYDIVNSLNKVKHNHKMLSLDKTKSEDKIQDFVGNNSFVAMAKMDGLTCSLKYQNGELISAETRGNGEIGEDITHNAKVIPSIPKNIPLKDEIIVDGEIICTYKDFKEFENDYKNPRNFAAGSIRLLDAKECAGRKLTFIAWELVSGVKETSFHKRLDILQRLGFDVVPWIMESPAYAINDIKDKCQNIYPIDGIVFKFDNIEYGKSLGETNHHRRDAIAFKFYDELYETNLLDIEWSMGRTGQITPVAIFDPIEIEGSMIEKANLHNISIMAEQLRKPHKGEILYVYRSNQIIPQIHHSEDVCSQGLIKYFEIPDKCPVCGEPTVIKQEINSKILYCENPFCQGKLINQIEHFFGKKGLDIKGISLATFEKLINWGWVNEVIDVFNLNQYKDEWIKKPGFGEKSVNKILSSIEEGKTTDLNKFICAIGIPQIGTVASKQLATTFETWESFREAVNNKFDFTKLNDFGSIIDYEIRHFNYKKADEIATILNILPYKAQEQVSFKLEGKKIAITGALYHLKNRAELQKMIELSGGKVVSSVSKNTDILVNNDNTSNSAKNIAAKKLNIPILTEKEFLTEYID